MVASINLIPEEEIIEQKKTQAVKFSTIFSIILLIIVGGVSAYFFNITSNLKAQKSQLESDIDELRGRVKSYSEVEITARNLNAKYNVLVNFYKERVYYSLALKEVNSRKPAEVNVTGISLREGTYELSGDASSFIAIQNFVSNLANKDFENGNPDLKALFTSVALTSVNLVESDQSLTFNLSLDLDNAVLSTKNRGL